jgi:hypothetical protein
MAAVLACPAGTLLSHMSAAWLWGLQPRCPVEVEVTATGTGHRRRGIRVHHGDGVGTEWGHIDRIPVTALPCTLLDVAATRPSKELAEAIDRAKRLGLLQLGPIDRLLERRSRSPGAGRLRKAVDLYRNPVFDRARSELLLLDLIEKSGLPRPALNLWVGQFEIDAYWENERFAVEVDGWEAHGTRRAFEEDRVRIEEMKLNGIDTIQITARRIERQPREVGRRLQLHLERRRSELHS